MTTTHFDLLIRRARTFLPDENALHGLREDMVDIGVKNGKIAQLGSLHTNTATEIWDAAGLYVLPGLVDSQVHFREPGLTHKEDFQTGTRAAVLGGITAVFEMPNTNPSTTTQAALEDKLERAKKMWCDHAFYIGGAHDNVEQLGQLERLPGTPGVKIFMGSSTGTLLVEDDATLERILRSGTRRMTFHSEDEFILRERKEIAVKSGQVTDHPVWRNVDSAISSTKRLLALAEKVKRNVHVLHVSTAEEMEFLQHHKNRATIEVLPQHLTFYAPDVYERLGTKAQQNPPIREKRHREALRKALQMGLVDVIGSDHAPHTLEEKNKPYPNSPSGMPMVQTTVPLMLTHVNEGLLSLDHFVKLMTEGPRRIFGMQHKGRIELGADADFTLIDLKCEQVIESNWLASKCGWSPLEGFRAKGWPVGTIVRGHIVMRDEEILGAPIGAPVKFYFD